MDLTGLKCTEFDKALVRMVLVENQTYIEANVQADNDACAKAIFESLLEIFS